jgi:hypothetical protein
VTLQLTSFWLADSSTATICSFLGGSCRSTSACSRHPQLSAGGRGWQSQSTAAAHQQPSIHCYVHGNKQLPSDRITIRPCRQPLAASSARPPTLVRRRRWGLRRECRRATWSSSLTASNSCSNASAERGTH